MRALDLFCGGGGAALGLMAAGWEVVGVDSDPRCAAAYPGAFVRADWREALRWLNPAAFDLVWASPPCQRWASPTALTRDADGRHRPSAKPDLIGPVRGALVKSGVPFVIENVPRAPLRCDLAITGPMVGLESLYRLRHFELRGGSLGSLLLPTKGARPSGSVAEGTLVSVTTRGGIPRRATRAKRARLRPDLQSSRFRRADMVAAMGLPADTPMSMRQVGEAVPPRYAEVVGRIAMAALRPDGDWPIGLADWAPDWLPAGHWI